MWFGTLKIDDERLDGAILAHSAQDAGGRKIAKGSVIDARLIEKLRNAGRKDLIVAVPDAGDLNENEAAKRLAEAFVGDTGSQNIVLRDAGTGRVNMHAVKAGVLTFDATAIHAFNGVTPAITIATLPPNVRVDADQMVATIKIIPFAVASADAETAIGKAQSAQLRTHPFGHDIKVGLIQTELPTVKPTVLDKTAALTAARLEPIGGTVTAEARCAHVASAISGKLSELATGNEIVIIFGASAVTDLDDVIPAAIVAAGGEIIHVGMPVDPGNLLVLGKLGDVWVIGAPGCARSPKRNGFDWVLERLCAGIDVTAEDIVAMGVGGLLSEIESRPQPRAAK